jgi:hypothetical protein
MIISVGYRVNSVQAINFWRWATSVLKEFAKKGYIIDRKRMGNGRFFDEDYFEHLLADDRDLLQNAGKISAQIAKDKAENEFEKFRPIQDRLFESDFDRAIKELTEKK